eukprot:snap_masked-scaffold_13-processed-gene-11.52-mRNA-1 protein AED:1.00 eAED:1.00 QI:0/0/0/0/1/1/2/0/62
MYHLSSIIDNIILRNTYILRHSPRRLVSLKVYNHNLIYYSLIQENENFSSVGNKQTIVLQLL